MIDFLYEWSSQISSILLIIFYFFGLHLSYKRGYNEGFWEGKFDEYKINKYLEEKKKEFVDDEKYKQEFVPVHLPYKPIPQSEKDRLNRLIRETDKNLKKYKAEIKKNEQNN